MAKPAFTRICPILNLIWYDFSRRKLLKVTTSNDPVADLYLEVGNQHFEEHPFGTYYFQTGDRKARTLADFLSETQLE